ncbi:MAG: DUF4349 domain-containing protein [Clostridia bacterium]|nr:DUF4349 domain-containing protein [Clostridia bacterium]
MRTYEEQMSIIEERIEKHNIKRAATKRRIINTLPILVAVIAVTFIAGAVGNSKRDTTLKEEADSNRGDYYNYSSSIKEEVAFDAIFDMDSDEGVKGSDDLTTDQSQTSDRKIIKTANMSAETKNFDEFLSIVEGYLSEKGGYIENKEMNNNTDFSGRKCYLTIRIPEAELDGLMKKIGENATVTYENIRANDVTDSYNDNERQIKVLETEQQRLLELLKKAESLDDILEIESRLTQIRYELSSYEQQIEEYDDSVSYSALSLNVSEVEREAVAKDDSFFTKVSEGFMTSISDIGHGFTDIAVGFLSITPYLALIAVILLVAYFVVKAIIKRK